MLIRLSVCNVVINNENITNSAKLPSEGLFPGYQGRNKFSLWPERKIGNDI